MSTADCADAFSNIDQNSIAASAKNVEVETDKYGFVGGKEYTNPEQEKISVDKIRKSEGKWLEMLDNWDKWMSKKFAKVKKRCRKGIPSSLRGRAWQLLCGSKHLQDRNKNIFQGLIQAEGEARIAALIDRDLHRQFPYHEMFCQKGGNGQQDLRDILNAYAIFNPRDNYCQAQAPIAAVLLMHMPAEEAFWCMVAIFDFYIPGYFSPGLSLLEKLKKVSDPQKQLKKYKPQEAVQIDGDITQGLLRHVAPAAHQHLQQQEVSPMLYCTEWFMCIFSRGLPWPCMLRLWDMFFCEGIKVIFRSALVVLKLALGNPDDLKQLTGVHETAAYIKNYKLKDIDPDIWIKQIIDLKINEEDLENEHKHQLKLRQSQNKPTSSMRRNYRHVPVLSGSGTSTTLTQKKHLRKISVDSSLITEQTLSLTGLKKRGKVNSSPVKKNKHFLGVSPTRRRHSHDMSYQKAHMAVIAAASSFSIPEATELEKKGFG